MSDTINVLNTIVGLCGQRKSPKDPAGTFEKNAEDNFAILENIVEAAGDCLEDHVAASLRAKPRKQRVYKEIVESIAVHFCDELEDPEQSYHAYEEVRTILHNFKITTRDFEGKEVKI